MQIFKETTITKTPHGFLPRLHLNGKWLDDIAFTNGALVSAFYRDSCLILSTNTNAIDQYSVLCVKSKIVRGQPRTQLTLDGLLLKRYGFNIGDRVVLHLMPNMIQITKINQFTTVKVA